ncbi:MAG: hypothetical protein ABI237_05025 [Ginsengibacter sp.]
MKKIFLFAFISLLFQSCNKHDKFPVPTQTGILYYCAKPIASGAYQVYKKDLTTNAIDTITNNTSYNYWWVDLSPDKTQLLLLRSPVTSPKDQFDYENCEMIKCNADGSNQQVIIANKQYGWFAFGNPHWYKTGKRILLIAQAANSTAPFYTYTVDTDGNNPKALTTSYSIDANWSQDGNKITFIGIDAAGFKDATSFEVFTANYDYTSNSISSIKQLTTDATRDQDACFSPDGSHIAFSASDAGLTHAVIVTIDVTGNNRTKFLDDGGIHGGPLNWGSDDKIYNHSIYPGKTNFTTNALNTTTKANETLLASPSFDYISPYYFK